MHWHNQANIHLPNLNRLILENRENIESKAITEDPIFLVAISLRFFYMTLLNAKQMFIGNSRKQSSMTILFTFY